MNLDLELDTLATAIQGAQMLADLQAAGQGRKGTSQKVREAAPASSEVSQDESPREPAPSAPVSTDPEH